MKTLDEFKTFYENELADAIEATHGEIENIDGSEVPVTLFDRLQAAVIVWAGVGIVFGPIIYGASGEIGQAVGIPFLAGAYVACMRPKAARVLFKRLLFRMGNLGLNVRGNAMGIHILNQSSEPLGCQQYFAKRLKMRSASSAWCVCSRRLT